MTHTGVAGLTLGGGIGWLMRKYGLTVDQLLAVEMVTADGKVVRASGPRTPTCSGVFAAAAETSASSPGSSSASTRRTDVLAGPCSGRSRGSGGGAPLPRLVADAPDELTTIVFHRTAPALRLCRPRYAASSS